MGWLLALSLSFALASGLSEHVEQLGHADPALREAAAAALRASPPPDEQGEAWSARVAQVRDGMTRAQDEALLPVLETGPGLSMGRSIRQSWRLDTYWTVSAIFLRGKLGAGPAGPGAPSPLLLGGAPSGTHGHLVHLVRQRPEEPRDRIPLGEIPRRLLDSCHGRTRRSCSHCLGHGFLGFCLSPPAGPRSEPLSHRESDHRAAPKRWEKSMIRSPHGCRPPSGEQAWGAPWWAADARARGLALRSR